MKYLLIIICLQFTSTLTIFAQSFNQKNLSGNFTNNIDNHHQLYLNEFYTSSPPDSTNKVCDRIVIIAGEFGFGSLMGVLLSLPAGYLAAGMSNENDLGYGLMGMYGGYVIGTSLGVYFVAKKENKNVSFVNTLACGVAGAVIGIYIFHKVDQKGPLSASPMLLPTIASITYVNLIDNPSHKEVSLNVSPLYSINSGDYMLNLSIQF